MSILLLLLVISISNIEHQRINLPDLYSYNIYNILLLLKLYINMYNIERWHFPFIVSSCNSNSK